MSDPAYRNILRSSSIVGGAQLVDIMARVAKIKVAALLLGPAGVGLLGLYTNLMQTAGLIAGVGINNVGTRQVADIHVNHGEVALGRTRRALFWAALFLGAIGGLAFWLCSGWLARTVLSGQASADEVAWLAVGVALTVAAGSQAALLMGTRRLGEFAWVTMGSSVAAALLGIAALWLWGRHGLLFMTLIAPAMTYLLGLIFVARIGRPVGRGELKVLCDEWKAMAGMGVAFMVGGVIAMVGPLIVRAYVQRQLGADSLGQFQAAWSIGALYLAFILSAMGTDFFPRLTAVIRDRFAVVKLVNQQTEVALLLCAPVLLIMLGFTPWIVRQLYSSEFGPAVEVLRWQLLGDILRTASWPLGFILQAAGAAKTFIVTELLGMSVFVIAVVVGLPLIGLQSTGIAFLAMYVVYLPIVWWLARRRVSFRWTRTVKTQLVALGSSAVAVSMLCIYSEPFGEWLAAVLAVSLAFWALMRLSAVGVAGGKLARFAAIGTTIRTLLRR